MSFKSRFLVVNCLGFLASMRERHEPQITVPHGESLWVLGLCANAMIAKLRFSMVNRLRFLASLRERNESQIMFPHGESPWVPGFSV